MLKLLEPLRDLLEWNIEDFGNILRHARCIMAFEGFPEARRQHGITLGLSTTDGRCGQLCIEFLSLLENRRADSRI